MNSARPALWILLSLCVLQNSTGCSTKMEMRWCELPEGFLEKMAMTEGFYEQLRSKTTGEEARPQLAETAHAERLKRALEASISITFPEGSYINVNIEHGIITFYNTKANCGRFESGMLPVIVHSSPLPDDM